jgi:hypothetical protein
VSYASEALAQRIRELGQTVFQEGDVVRAGEHEICVSSEIENEVQHNGRWLIGMVIHVELDGKYLPAMRTGTVGVDLTREGALQVASKDWSQQFGIPLVHALFPQPADPQPKSASGVAVVVDPVAAPATVPLPIRAGDYNIYLGPTALRGPIHAKDFAAGLKQLRGVVAAFAAHTLGQSKEWHGMNVQVSVDPHRGSSSMCHLDGKPSAAFIAATRDVSWPSAHFFLNQFYLAVPAE